MPNWFCTDPKHSHKYADEVLLCEFNKFFQATRLILDQGITHEEAAAVTGLGHVLYPRIESIDCAKN